MHDSAVPQIMCRNLAITHSTATAYLLSAASDMQQTVRLVGVSNVFLFILRRPNYIQMLDIAVTTGQSLDKCPGSGSSSA